MSPLEKTVAALKDKFAAAIEHVVEFRGEVTVTVSPPAALAVLRFLKESPDLRYTFLADLTVRDQYPREPRFEVIYQLREMTGYTPLRVKCAVPGGDPVLPTATGLFPNAGWYEREAFDLFGLTFTGHPDLRRLLLPEGWHGHPLRKDCPLGYEEVQFTFNFDEIDGQKTYARGDKVSPR